jgi:hypothetical protein
METRERSLMTSSLVFYFLILMIFFKVHFHYFILMEMFARKQIKSEQLKLNSGVYHSKKMYLANLTLKDSFHLDALRISLMPFHFTFWNPPLVSIC